MSATAAPPATRAVRIGCSGWQYRDWRGVLYPEGMGQPRWLARYKQVVVSRERSGNAKKPGPIVLRGALPSS